MYFHYLIGEGYLALAGFLALHIISSWRGNWLIKLCLKKDVIFPPFKKWAWVKPPDNHRSVFYVDVVFGAVFLFMAQLFMSAPGYAIMVAYLSLICWIIAARLFYRVWHFERQQMN